MPDGAKKIYRRTNEDGVVEKYPIDAPPLMDRLKGQRAYAYSRYTREPVHFREGSIPFEGPDTLGRHSDFPLVGGIDVVVDNPDYPPQQILQHEQLHHTFPMFTPQDEQHAYIDSMVEGTEVHRNAAMGALPQDVDRRLFERISRYKPRTTASR